MISLLVDKQLNTKSFNCIIVVCILVASNGSAKAAHNPTDKTFLIQSVSCLPDSNFNSLIGSTLRPIVCSSSACAWSAVTNSSLNTYPHPRLFFVGICQHQPLFCAHALVTGWITSSSSYGKRNGNALFTGKLSL